MGGLVSFLPSPRIGRKIIIFVQLFVLSKITSKKQLEFICIDLKQITQFIIRNGDVAIRRGFDYLMIINSVDLICKYDKLVCCT